MSESIFVYLDKKQKWSYTSGIATRAVMAPCTDRRAMSARAFASIGRHLFGACINVVREADCQHDTARNSPIFYMIINSAHNYLFYYHHSFFRAIVQELSLGIRLGHKMPGDQDHLVPRPRSSHCL